MQLKIVDATKDNYFAEVTGVLIKNKPPRFVTFQNLRYDEQGDLACDSISFE